MLATVDGSGNHLPVRCVTLNAAGGYDTHSNQAAALSTGLLATASNLRAFWRDLELRGLADRVVISLWSEFGRRPAENGSGTDHGAAGAAFVIGKDVKQGLIGEFPGLAAGTAAWTPTATCARPPTSAGCTARCSSSGFRPRRRGSSRRPASFARPVLFCDARLAAIARRARGAASPAAAAVAPASGADAKRSVLASVAKKQACVEGVVAASARKSCRRARASARVPARHAARPRAARPAQRRARPRRARASRPPTPPSPARPRRRPATRRPGPPADPVPVASTIGAEAYDFGVVRPAPHEDLGPGRQPHDLLPQLRRQRPQPVDRSAPRAGAPTQISAAVGEGGGATKTVAVTPGTWRFYCSLLGHEAMTHDLTVQ